jgi:tocopherol O-methyltransferase
LIAPREPVTSLDVARHYDELDPVYRELWGEHLHHGLFRSRRDDPQIAAARLVSLVAGLGGIGPETDVCDVGCGYGATARELAVLHGARSVTGITLSEVQLRHARIRTAPGVPVTFHQGDWLANDFEDASFEVVVALECLAHMEDKPAFFREAHRTLRPGGRLVVCAWLAAEGAGRLSRRFLLEPICREGELPGIGSAPEYTDMARAAGLEVEVFRELGPDVRRTWSISAARLAGALLRRPEYRELLRDPALRSRVFARSVFRIWLAYRIGAMGYGVLAARKPGPGGVPLRMGA